MENLLYRIFKNEKLDTAKRFEAGANIFQIDKFYKPKSKIEDLFLSILELEPQDNNILSKAYISDSILVLTDKYFNLV